MSNIKKLSVKTVYGNIDLEKLIKAPNKELHVMRVMGLAVGVASGESTYGEWQSLRGQFEATNPETGEVSESSVLFLPDVALTPILVSLSRPEVKGVEFAIDISVHYAQSKKPGGSPYEYSFRAILPPDENDPISRLKARVLALAAPTPAAGDAAPAAAAPASKGKGK